MTTINSTLAAPTNNVGIEGDGLCLCGCGVPTAKRSAFVQGHDARLHHKLRLVAAGTLPPAVITKSADEYLLDARKTNTRHFVAYRALRDAKA